MGAKIWLPPYGLEGPMPSDILVWVHCTGAVDNPLTACIHHLVKISIHLLPFSTLLILGLWGRVQWVPALPATVTIPLVVAAVLCADLFHGPLVPTVLPWPAAVLGCPGAPGQCPERVWCQTVDHTQHPQAWSHPAAEPAV
jgi:hypothetical protein